MHITLYQGGFMELIKENIHMNMIKKSVTTQLTLEDDFNVPDVKPDIDTIITNDYSITMDTIKVLDARVIIKGKLEYKILYTSDDSPTLNVMTGALLIDETIHTEGLNDTDCITVKYELDDLTTGVINSRKISVKGIITFTVNSEYIYDIETATDIKGDNIYFDRKDIEVIQIAECKKDIYRIKEEITLPNSLPEIDDLLWDTTRIKNISTKLADNALQISGEISTCILYKSNTSKGMEWLEESIPFSGNIPLSGVNETMIPDIEITLPVKNINIKSDTDGEARILEYDMVLDLNIKIYKELSLHYLNDVYSTSLELIPTYNNVTYNQLIMKNISNCKINDRLKLDVDKGYILQVCGNEGEVKTENISLNDEGILVEGVIILNLMCITSDDKMPVSIIKEVIPFTHTIEAPSVNDTSLIYIRPSLEHLSTSMNIGNEIEVKCLATMDTLVLGTYDANIITGVTTNPLNIEKISAMPGMLGYKVKEGDTLFSIAKKYSTTIDDIKEINGLTSDLIQPGNMLLVVKRVG